MPVRVLKKWGTLPIVRMNKIILKKRIYPICPCYMEGDVCLMQ